MSWNIAQAARVPRGRRAGTGNGADRPRPRAGARATRDTRRATVTTPPPGEDILTASSNNLYLGVSLEDLDGFAEHYPLNSRLVKRDGRLVEETYRIDGRYGPQIREIVHHLEAAREMAPVEMAAALDALITWYRTGEATDRRAYDIAWVEDADSPIDTINGFTEVYLDARGRKGAWEALVFYENAARTEATVVFSGEAAQVRLTLFDMLGRELRQVYEGPGYAGRLALDVRGLASGLYFLRMEAGEVVQTKKMIVLD